MTYVSDYFLGYFSPYLINQHTFHPTPYQLKEYTMLKMDIILDDVQMSAIRHEGLWRIVTEWRGEESDWIPSIEATLTDAKMGALLAFMMDGEENQGLLDEAFALLTLDEVRKFAKAGLIP